MGGLTLETKEVKEAISKERRNSRDQSVRIQVTGRVNGGRSELNWAVGNKGNTEKE